jgi:hypothetical protein
MLADPVHWYENLPAAVPDFGPLKEHFVRGIGCAFAVQGVALGMAAFLPAWRVAVCGAVALFYGLHALVHVGDTLRGLVGPEHWRIDFAGVYLQALLMLVVTWLVARRPREPGSHSRRAGGRPPARRPAILALRVRSRPRSSPRRPRPAPHDLRRRAFHEAAFGEV